MLKPCTRFRADGRPCPNRTNRADGWCGNCDGYGNAEATPLKDGKDPSFVGRWFSSVTNWTKATPPIEVDEVQDVSVTRSAVQWYANHHGTTIQEAEAQIRSLLEDILLTGQTMHNERGFWRLQTAGRNGGVSGYGLSMDPECGKVLAYHTRHRERTYAQVKAGVKSRTSQKPTGSARRRRKEARLREMLEQGSQQVRDAVEGFDGEKFSDELFGRLGISKDGE